MVKKFQDFKPFKAFGFFMEKESQHSNHSKAFGFFIWLLFYLIIFATLLNQSFNHLDPDLGWHLKVGEDIAREKKVPGLEYYNYTLEGKTWVDHEWLINFFSYQLYDRYAYGALAVFFSLLVIITLLIQRRLITEYICPEKNNYYLLMFLQFTGLAASLPHLGVRMQIITLLGLQIILFILYKYSITKNHQLLLCLLPLFYIWSCLHAGFLIGIVVVGLYAGIKSVELLSNKYYKIKIFDYSSTHSFKEIVLLATALLVSIASTFFTPYGLHLYEFLTSYTNTFYAKVITEWMPFYYLPIQYKQLFFAAIVVSALSLLLILFFSQSKEKSYKISFWQLSLTIIFLVMAMKSKRHFPLFFIASTALTISIFYHYFSLPPRMERLIFQNRFSRFFLTIVFVLIFINFMNQVGFTRNPFQSRHGCKENPCQAVAFLKNQPELTDKKIFNTYGWGGYMIWEWPGKKLFIDGRLPQYKYNEHTLLEEYLDFFDEEKVEKKLNEHGIEVVLLLLNQDVKFNWFEKTILKLNEEEFNNQKIALQEYLKNSPEWKLVYSDKLSNIFLKSQK
jgi:hypothetical protein